MTDRLQLDLQQLPSIAGGLGQAAGDLGTVAGRLRSLERAATASVAPAQRARSQIADARRQIDRIGQDLLDLQRQVRQRAQEVAAAEGALGQDVQSGLGVAGQAAAAGITGVDQLLLDDVALLKDAGLGGKLGREAVPRAYGIVTTSRKDMRARFKSYGRLLNQLAGSKRAGWVGRMDRLSKLVPHVQARRVPDWVMPTGTTLARGLKGLGLLTTYTDELGVEQRAGRTGLDGAAEAAATTTLGTLAKTALTTYGDRALESTAVRMVAETVLERVAPRLATRVLPGVGEVLMAVDGVHLLAMGAEWGLDQTGHHDLARMAGSVKDLTDTDKHLRDAIRPVEDWFISDVMANPQVQRTLQLGQLPLPAGP